MVIRLYYNDKWKNTVTFEIVADAADADARAAYWQERCKVTGYEPKSIAWEETEQKYKDSHDRHNREMEEYIKRTGSTD
jgi:hypothetical protein